ncbi:MAG: 4-(cytidine 5'-diphospho)-2-C-methyl-D-erythritol kinase [Clostridiaceae bacterium]
MDRTSERAYAKLNLTLGVLYKRSDGYHALDSIMQSIDLCDTVSIERASDIVVTSTGMLLPYDNTVRRAAEQYRALTGRGAHIRVTKRIPAEAGMGGGSADAAATLLGLQKIYGEADEKTLFELGASVGADVPFCMRGGVQRAEGIGEVLTPLRGMKLFFLVVKPKEGVSTKKLFSMLKLPRIMPETTACIKALAVGDLGALAPLLYNALEEPAIELVPEIGAVKTALLEAGALAACMTGSGSAVFGLFETRELAETALPKVEHFAFSRVCESIG